MKRNVPTLDVSNLIARPRPRGVIGNPQANGYQTATLLGEVKSELERIGSQVKGAAEKALAQSKEALELGEKHHQQIESLRAMQHNFEQQVIGSGRHYGGGYGGPPSLGQSVIDHELYQAFLAQGSGSVRLQITTAPDSAGALMAPDRDVPANLPRRRLRVRDLLNAVPTESGRIEVPVQTTRDNQAAMVSEGAEKPESDYDWELREFPVRTIAHFVRVSRQAFEDAPSLAATINGELQYGLDLKEEEQLLLGAGIGQNLEGMIPAAEEYNTDLTQSGDTMLDIVRHAVKQAELADVPATGVIVNTSDWFNMLGLKDGEDRYLIPGGPTATAPPALWQLPLVPSNTMPEGEFLVGAFGIAAQIRDRMVTEVLISSEDGDNFRRNMLTIRAEKRLALVIRQPRALVHGEFAIVT